MNSNNRYIFRADIYHILLFCNTNIASVFFKNTRQIEYLRFLRYIDGIHTSIYIPAVSAAPGEKTKKIDGNLTREVNLVAV